MFVYIKSAPRRYKSSSFDNADRLNEAGVFRPVTGALDNAVSWGHHELAWTLRDGDKSGLWRKARLEIAGKKAVVSSEEYCLIRGAHSYAPVRDAFDGWSIRPICYVRRQDQLLESMYNHHVKSLGETEDIQSFAKRLRRRLDYKQFIDTLEGVFGQGSITVHVYDKREFDDLFDDFLLQLGVNGAGWNRPATAVNLSCCRFRGHRETVFHEAGGLLWGDGYSVGSSRSRRFGW